jgi:hypothetical protein
MTIEQAALFLACSILTVLGFLIILIGILIGNNLVAQYWKSWGWKLMPAWYEEPPRFINQDNTQSVDKTIEPKMK